MPLLLVAFDFVSLSRGLFFLNPWLGICTRVSFRSVGRVELYRLRVNAIFQHPALVVVGAATKLVLLVCVHRPVFYPEASVCGHVLVPLQSSFVPLPDLLVVLLFELEAEIWFRLWHVLLL